MKKIVGLMLCMSLVTGLMAQVEQLSRYEHVKDDEDDFFTVISCEENGLLIVEEDHVKGKVEKWILTGLDTALVKKWALDLAIDYQYDFRAYEIFGDNVFLVFQESDRVIANYRIVKINVNAGSMVSFVISNQIAFELTNIIAVKDRLILGGYVRYSPTLLSYEIGADRFQIVPGYFKDRSDIIDLRANGEDTYNIITREKSYSGPFLRLRTYSYDSQELFERVIQIDQKYEVIDGTSMGFVNGNMAVVGTYGARNSKYVQGIYFALVRPDGQDNMIKYNDLSEFDNFFDYTASEKRADRLKEKAENLSDRGKEMKVGVRLFMHDVIPLEKSYLIVADVYDVKYDVDNRTRYITRPMYSMYDIRTLPRGRYTYMDDPSQRSIYDATMSYEYLAAIAIDMDSKGNILWDNSLIVEDKERFILDALVDAYAAPDSVYLAYKKEEDIIFKGIPYSSEPIEANIMEVELKNESDDLRNSSENVGEMEYWYGSNYYIWGYQKINDKAVRGSEGKREVIYVNKVSFPARRNPVMIE